MNWIANNFKFGKNNKNNTNDQSLSFIYHEKQVKELCALHALNKYKLYLINPIKRLFIIV